MIHTKLKRIFVLVSGLGILLCFYVSHQVSKHDISTEKLKVQEQKKDVRVDKVLGVCEKCGKALRKVNGRFGPFIGCSGYPECRYIQRKKASFLCPVCCGDIEQRVWSGGVVWGCSNYPECRYAIFSDIKEVECAKCKKGPFLKKVVQQDGAIGYQCPLKDCLHVQ